MSDATDLANTLASALLTGTDFDVPMPDFTDGKFSSPATTGTLYDPVVRVENTDLTEGETSISGSGMFDLLMRGFKAHLTKEFESNRISGAEYTKAYIALTEAAMANATQFLLGRDLAHWQVVNAQLQARVTDVGAATARVELESAKTRLQVIRLEAMNQQVTYALNKMRLASQDVEFETALYNLETMLPKQAAQLDAETSNAGKQGLLLDDEHALQDLKSDLLTAQVTTAENQALQVAKQTELAQTEVDLGVQKLALLTKQVAQAEAQTNLTLKQVEQAQNEIDLFDVKEALLQEQVEGQRAQTMDTRTDGATPVAGVLGQQKSLYAQQVTSYQRDAEVKAAKIFSDAWITMKTIDEGLAPPTYFSNANLDVILASIKSNNGL